MGVATDFILGMREAFTLEHAERAAIDEGARRDDARKFVQGANARLASAARLSLPRAAVPLLRDALELAIRASRVDHDAPVDLAAELGARDDVVGEWARSSEPLFVEELPFARGEELRDALDAEVRARLAALDVRSVTAIRALRWGRFVALTIVLAMIASWVARTKFLPHNVALGKNVLTNGVRGDNGPFNGPGVVDGRTRGTFGVSTNDSPHPFVTIDLAKPYAITRVRIFNRGDGWYDESLPLALAISDDNATFREVARRTTHFDVWTVDFAPTATARFVRVAKMAPGAVTLNEIEIYSRDN